jgi:uncharacterized protein (TIRG00374 family)
MQILSSMNLYFILLSFIAYFGMNILFALRLKRVIKTLGHSVSFKKILMIQYGGMLASDITPARSGYFVVPVMLNAEKIPIPVGLSAILGIQSIEFFVKMFGGCLAVFYLLTVVNISRDIFIISIIGVALMCLGGVVLAAAMWSKRAVHLIEIFAKIPLIAKFSRFLLDKITEFQVEGQKVKTIALEILLLTVISWVFKALEWYFIGLALGIDQISFLGYFLLHPLITALSFVPLTPSGVGFQEGAAVGALYLLGVGADIALAFALMARLIVTIQDLLGVYEISKTGVKVLEAISTIRRH